MINKITSVHNEKIVELLKYSKNSYKYEKQAYLIEGFHIVELALKQNLVSEIFTLKELKDVNVDQYIVSEEIMKKISSSKTPQGIVAVVKMKQSISLKSNKVLYLDGVSDPGNIGTILRTALAFSYTDVILSSSSCSVYNEKVVQASQGAILSLNIFEDGFDLLKSAKGYEIIATELNGSESLTSLKNLNNHILVLGNEAHGVSEEVLKLATKRVRIDIDNIESLNVAIAGGIAMYELSK